MILQQMCLNLAAACLDKCYFVQDPENVTFFQVWIFQSLVVQGTCTRTSTSIIIQLLFFSFSLGSGHSDGEDGEESNQSTGIKYQDTPRRTFAQVQLEALENEFNKSNYHDVFSRDEMANRMEYVEQLRSQVCILIPSLLGSTST
jgi:hypothetical protein